MLSLREIGQKRKMVVKIEFTPLSHSPDRKIFPFKKGFKKEKGTQYVYIRKPILDHNSLRFTYPPNYFNPQFKLVNKFGNLNNIKYSHNLCSCSKLSHLSLLN